MGDMADDLMDRLDMVDANFYGCDEWCEGCPGCAADDQWVTREGKVLDIRKMETSHLVNTLNFVARHRMARHFGHKRMANVKKEAVKRGCYRWMRVGKWMPPKT